MKPRLGRQVDGIAPDRAGAPRPAAQIQTIGAFGPAQMAGAGIDVVTLAVERRDRTGREARLVGAALAGAWPLIALGQAIDRIWSKASAPR